MLKQIFVQLCRCSVVWFTIVSPLKRPEDSSGRNIVWPYLWDNFSWLTQWSRLNLNVTILWHPLILFTYRVHMVNFSIEYCRSLVLLLVVMCVHVWFRNVLECPFVPSIFGQTSWYVLFSLINWKITSIWIVSQEYRHTLNCDW